MSPGEVGHPPRVALQAMERPCWWIRGKTSDHQSLAAYRPSQHAETTRATRGGWPTVTLRGISAALAQYALFAFALLLPLCSIAAESPATQPTRFEIVNVYVDSGDRPLAAWQVELKATQGDVKIVGVEGGDHRDLYRDPPYYDPAALSTGRIILASYTTSDHAPKGDVLVARVHLRIVGAYHLGISPMVAADPTGQPVKVDACVGQHPATRASKGKE